MERGKGGKGKEEGGSGEGGRGKGKNRTVGIALPHVGAEKSYQMFFSKSINQ